jgi:aryl-alcohol dehydrogenase-like predicted oxidoreductase
MNYHTLGRTGLQVSEIGFGGAPAGLRNYLGAWEPERDESAQQIAEAIAHAVGRGVNYFDTAPGYGDGASERMFGRGIQPFRSRITLATKLFAENAEDVRRSVEASLERLQVAHLDVIQLHGTWYCNAQADQILAPGGALSGLQAVKNEGQVRFIGLTAEGVNGPLSRLIASRAFDVLQICYNLIYQHPYDPTRKAGVLFEAEAQGMGIVTMRSLTSGIFQKWLGRVFPDEMGDPARQDHLRQALLGFVLSNPLVDCALVGMRTIQEVDANVAACEDPNLRVNLDWLHERFV